jgi:hypothetical protein
MKALLFALLVAHGVAHFVGFAVPWRLLASPEMPYKTTVLNGRIDLGGVGIRTVGALWLVVGATMIAAGAAWLLSWPAPMRWTIGSVLASLVLCVVEWPLTRIGLTVNVGLLIAMPLVAQRSWNQQTMRALTQLGDPRTDGLRSDARAEDLPAPAARYFRRALPAGAGEITGVDLAQTGEMFVGNAWRSMTAVQRFTTNPPGYVWDARVRMAPLVAVNVRDMYAHGTGSMRASALAAIPIVNQAGTPELDAAALHRYFAEAVWFPTALLPGSRVSWSPLDDRRAIATLTDAHTRVSLEFRFDEAGDVTEVFARDRFAESHGRYEPRPWLVRCREHATFEGVRVPTRCEVEWQLPSGPLVYWRAQITSLRFTWTTS